MARPAKAARAVATALEPANHFELRRGRTRITYTVSDKGGQPQLGYDDGEEQRTFRGDEVRIEATALGSLVTVTLRFVADGPTDLLTVILPEVLLKDHRAARFRTPVVFHTVAGSLVGHPTDPGPVQTYAVKTYRGTASFVVS